jgi:hypothetical protein
MIQYLETGERGLSAKWLRKLASALDTTPGMLLDHDPETLDPDILEIWGKPAAASAARLRTLRGRSFIRRNRTRHKRQDDA